MRAHSLALISEAGHNVSDFLALALSFVAVYFQTRPATDEKTFGYQRAGVLAAFVNALTLLVLSAWIAIAAIHRFAEPVKVEPHLMMCGGGGGRVDERVYRGAALEVFRRCKYSQRVSAHAW